MERIGVYCGSFDPPHLGNVHIVKRAMQSMDLTQLRILPVSSPESARLFGASQQQRQEMLHLLFDGVKNVEVSDLALREEKTDLAQLLIRLHDRSPEDELVLIVGTDAFLSLPNRNELESILSNASIGVICRADREEIQKVEALTKELESRGARICITQTEMPAISDSQLCRLIAFGCADDFLGEKLRTYMIENGLYCGGRDLRELSMDELEKITVGLLKSNRVAHVLGCRDTAVSLAEKWGANTADAARAGLLHDITKALSPSLQLLLCRTYGVALDDFSRENPKTLHALTGSLVADRIFGENRAVVDAIRFHTTGKGNMNTLEKIIYVADYMEPNRDFPGVEELRRLAYTDLDAALKRGLEMTLEMLRKQQREISPGSQEALRWICSVTACTASAGKISEK